MSLGRVKSTYLNRLNDQYTQKWQASVSSSSRLQVLSELKTDFNISKYLLDIRDPLIRKTLTRLKIDLNILQECKSRQTLPIQTTQPVLSVIPATKWCHLS